MRHFYLTTASLLLMVFNIKRIITPRLENNTLLLVKYGNLGDIYIMLEQLKKFDLDNSEFEVTIAVPEMYCTLVKEYLPNQTVFSLPNIRSDNLASFIGRLVKFSMSYFSIILLLGGSSSPIQEDLCVVFTNSGKKIRVKPDNSKGNIFTRFISQQFYDQTIGMKALFEADIIYKQLASIFSKKSATFYKSENSVSVDRVKKVLICPGASLSERRWTVKTLLAVIDQIKSLAIFTNITILGTKIDGAAYSEIKHFLINNKIIIKFENYELKDLENTITSSDIIVTNDSAPMHIARLYGLPMVVMSGQGHISRFIGDKNYGFKQLDCANCNWRCIFNQIVEKFPCVEILENKEHIDDFRKLFRRAFESI